MDVFDELARVGAADLNIGAAGCGRSTSTGTINLEGAWVTKLRKAGMEPYLDVTYFDTITIVTATCQHSSVSFLESSIALVKHRR